MAVSGVFDNPVINQVQQANDIVDVVGEHVNLSKKGREMAGLCPFHEDHRPSLYVNSPKQIFKCFACGAGGDVFKFVQMRENLTFPQAVERLAQRVGIELKFSKASKPKSSSGSDIDPNKLAKINLWAAEYFGQNLWDQKKGKFARDYVTRRKISSETARKWRIGLALSDNDLLKTAGTQKRPVGLLVKAGLLTGQNYDKFANRLIFAITDVMGRVIGFGGRTLDNADAKYINSPATALFDKSNCLYGLEQARHKIVSTGTAVVVEGYTDCIMAHQFGCDNVVATLGTSFTSGHGRILSRYAKEIVLIFDSDVAGKAAANRALDICVSQRIDIKIASVSDGKDPCDFILTEGIDKFQKLIGQAVDVFEFKWKRLVDDFDNDNTIKGRRAAIEEFLQTIAASIQSGNLSAIDKGLIVNRLSKIIGLDNNQINAEIARRAKRISNTAASSVKNQKVTSLDLGQGLLAAAQREVIEVLLNEPALLEQVRDKITLEMFDVASLRQIAGALLGVLDNNPHPELAEILAKVESVELSSCIVELAQQGEEKANYSSRLKDALDIIWRNQKRRVKPKIEAIKDQAQFLRILQEGVEKKNPHNLGMVE
ncbi:MAG: DNA primase [Planctomycetota bacterium]